MDPDHSWSPPTFGHADRQENPKRSQSAASKIVMVPASKQQSQPKAKSRATLEDALKKAKTEGSGETREFSSRPSEVSLAEASAKVARLTGSLAALGPDDLEERRALEDALLKVHARATVAPVGHRLGDCEKICERAAKRFEKAQEVVAEALKAQTQREEELAEGKRRLEVFLLEAAPRSASPVKLWDRRVDASAKQCCAFGKAS